MKKKMTKKEKLALYKASKAAEKQLREKHLQLAKYLANNCTLIITCMDNHYVHDCLVMPKDCRKDDELVRQMKMLHGDSKMFNYCPGRFTFAPQRFFDWAGMNPHLLQVIPTAVRDLYVEGLIKFDCIETNDAVNSATFSISC